MPTDLPTPRLYAVHIPDVDRALNPDMTVSETELPGFLEVGVDVGGARIPLLRQKAGHHADADGKLAFLSDGQAEADSDETDSRDAAERGEGDGQGQPPPPSGWQA